MSAARKIPVAFRGFESWEALIEHIQRGGRVYYWAPLDRGPLHVDVTLRKRGGRFALVRVEPLYPSADPFTANAGHLERFLTLTPEALQTEATMCGSRRICRNCGMRAGQHATYDSWYRPGACPATDKEPHWPTTIKDETRAVEVFDARMRRHWTKRTTSFEPVV